MSDATSAIMIYLLHQSKRREIIKLLQKNGEMSQHAIAQEFGLWDEQTRYHIDLLIKAGVLAVRYQRGDHHQGTDKMVRISDRAIKLVKQMRELE